MDHEPDTQKVFPHGVASFDPGPDRVILWTRIMPPETRAAAAAPTMSVHWHIAERSADGGVAGAVRSGTAEVQLDEPFVAVDVDALPAATDHLYWFECDGTTSPVGRTRTLPDGSPTSWRVAVTCCADYSINHLSAYREIARSDVDVVLHLGDYVYETEGKGGRRLDPDGVCVTLEDYDRRYAQVRSDPALLELHARHPLITIWDDHDIADNAWRHGAKAHDPDEHGPWEDRLRAAALARQRWLPARLPEPQDPLRLWRSFRAGDLAELVITDTRVDGRDQQAGDPGARPLDDPDRALLGPAQRVWLEERIRDRSSQWCVIATQVTMSPMRLPVPLGTTTLLEGAPSGYGIVDGAAVCVDEWDGYPAERRRVARWLADRGGDALLVSGDVHSSWVFDGSLTPGVAPVAPEFVAPGVSSTPLGRQLPRGWRRLASAAANRTDGALWFDLESWGFVLLDVTPTAITGSWCMVDARRDHPGHEVAATWTVGSGRPARLQPVGTTRRPVRERVLTGRSAASLLRRWRASTRRTLRLPEIPVFERRRSG